MANNLAIDVGTIAMASSYVSNGGEPLTIAGFSSIAAVLIPPRSGYLFEYDITNSKIKVYIETTGDSTGATAAFQEAGTGTDLSALSDVQYVAFGFV